MSVFVGKMSWRTSGFGRIVSLTMNTRRVGILGFDNVTALDMVGPADVFATAADLEPTA
jgi:hypothetical protein